MPSQQLTSPENEFLSVFPIATTFFVRGRLPAERRPMIAIVGTRKPTAYGEKTAYNITYELARQEIGVISGLALGIDAMAHRAALDADGYTLAVLANGVETITPQQNQPLGERILASGGAIISEYPDGTPLYPSQLLARNRIVSGLADAVIIVEAAAHSGTLATARHAIKQGRPVFVVPGRLTDAMSAGCLFLLDQYPEQIRIFTSVKQLLARLELKARLSPSRETVAASEPDGALRRAKQPARPTIQQQVEQLLNAGATSSEITTQLGLNAAQLAVIQTELELFG